MTDFDTLNALDLPTLISRKIWVTEKFCYFHTVILLRTITFTKYLIEGVVVCASNWFEHSAISEAYESLHSCVLSKK